MKAKLKSGYFIQEIAGEKILMGGGADVDYSKMMVLNNTSAFIIELLQQNTLTEEEIAMKLTERFDIDYSQVLSDVQDFCKRLSELKVIEEG